MREEMAGRMGAGRRQANFELLRIVAMFMIISLHYLVKGWVATPFPFAVKENPVAVFAWLVEAFCIVAVNCYVLISGYFLVESAWKPERVRSLLAQVLFYSLLRFFWQARFPWEIWISITGSVLYSLLGRSITGLRRLILSCICLHRFWLPVSK